MKQGHGVVEVGGAHVGPRERRLDDSKCVRGDARALDDAIDLDNRPCYPLCSTTTREVDLVEPVLVYYSHRRRVFERYLKPACLLYDLAEKNQFV